MLNHQSPVAETHRRTCCSQAESEWNHKHPVPTNNETTTKITSLYHSTETTYHKLMIHTNASWYSCATNCPINHHDRWFLTSQFSRNLVQSYDLWKLLEQVLLQARCPSCQPSTKDKANKSIGKQTATDLQITVKNNNNTINTAMSLRIHYITNLNWTTAVSLLLHQPLHLQHGSCTAVHCRHIPHFSYALNENL